MARVLIIDDETMLRRALRTSLTTRGHEVVEASRNTGVDVLSGVGVADSLRDAHVLVDVLNSPSFDDGPVL